MASSGYRFLPVCGQMVEDGERESRRLTGASLGDANDITLCEHMGNGLGLDGSGLFVTLFDKRARDGLGEAEIEKGGQVKIFHAAKSRGF